jgi:type III pantothenate kinase
MTLAVLIGNTNTRLNWFRNGRLLRRRLVPTAEFSRNCRRLVAAGGPVAEAGLASVVPAATSGCLVALRRVSTAPPLLVEPRTRTGLTFRYRRSELGADRVCVAVGARAACRRDVMAIDFGTAVTLNAVSSDGEFIGGAIVPGISLMLDALSRDTAMLPRTAPAPVSRPLATGTRAAMRAGTFNLLAGGIERLISLTCRMTGRDYYTIATGGGAGWFLRRIDGIDASDPDLAARGLFRLLQMNRGKDDSSRCIR